MAQGNTQQIVQRRGFRGNNIPFQRHQLAADQRGAAARHMIDKAFERCARVGVCPLSHLVKSGFAAEEMMKRVVHPALERLFEKRINETLIAE